jgi:hypothetical protein
MMANKKNKIRVQGKIMEKKTKKMLQESRGWKLLVL